MVAQVQLVRIPEYGKNVYGYKFNLVGMIRPDGLYSNSMFTLMNL